jgi:hypothetical protein
MIGYMAAIGLLTFGVVTIIRATFTISDELYRIKHEMFYGLFVDEVLYCKRNGRLLNISNLEYRTWLKTFCIDGYSAEDILKCNIHHYWNQFNVTPPPRINPPRQIEGTLATDCNSLKEVIPLTNNLRKK